MTIDHRENPKLIVILKGEFDNTRKLNEIRISQRAQMSRRSSEKRCRCGRCAVPLFGQIACFGVFMGFGPPTWVLDVPSLADNTIPNLLTNTEAETKRQSSPSPARATPTLPPLSRTSSSAMGIISTLHATCENLRWVETGKYEDGTTMGRTPVISQMVEQDYLLRP